MSNLKKKAEELKDKAAYYASAAPKVAEAYAKKAIGKKATDEEVKFRKSQCKSCVLYNLNKETNVANCNPKKLAAEDDNVLDFEFVRKAGYPLVKKGGAVVATVMNTKKYVRGCGCRMNGDNAKYTFHFTDSQLELNDGTGPCPRGLWNKNNFEKWKTKK